MERIFCRAAFIYLVTVSSCHGLLDLGGGGATIADLKNLLYQNNVQLLNSIQNLMTQSMSGIERKIEHLESRMEIKTTQLQRESNDRKVVVENAMASGIASLQKDLGDKMFGFTNGMDSRDTLTVDKISNKLHAMEQRLEGKIESNKSLDKLTQLETTISTQLAQISTEIKSEILNSLQAFLQKSFATQMISLKSCSENAESFLNKTSDLMTSMGPDLKVLKSFGQNNLVAVKNVSKAIQALLISEVSACRLNNGRDKTDDQIQPTSLKVTPSTMSSTRQPTTYKTTLPTIPPATYSTTSPTTPQTTAVATCHPGMGNSPTADLPPYILTIGGLQQDILCDTYTDGGGWIVIQRRLNGDVDFYRNWTQYKNGFGTPPGDFWLGNEAIHQLTATGHYELRIDMKIDSKELYAQYSSFKLEGKAENYRLELGTYSGTVGEQSPRYGLSRHNGMPFSTYDRDNDAVPQNCAATWHGAWWYNACHTSNLNALFDVDGPSGMQWNSGSELLYLSASEMKIRPN